MKVIQPVPFKKFHGAGNDFIVLQEGAIEPNPALISWLCNRHLGIGADGLMIVAGSKNYDFKLHYYNADGLEGSLCGNGSRVAVAYSYMTQKAKQNWLFEAVDGLHHGKILNAHQHHFDVRISMSDVLEFKQNPDYMLVDTGSPHYVSEVDNLSAIDVNRLGKAIRNDKSISENGVNVNFVQYLSENRIKNRTYERGVEHETLSCGTGVTAAAIAAALRSGKEHFIIETRGGELQVNLKQKGKGFGEIFLRGPVQFVYEGSVYLTERID